MAPRPALTLAVLGGGTRAPVVPCLSSTAPSGPARRAQGLPQVPRSPQPSTLSYVMLLSQHLRVAANLLASSYTVQMLCVTVGFCLGGRKQIA